MKDEAVSSFANYLYELSLPMPSWYSDGGPLFAELRRHLDEAKAKDDAYLASLSETERRRVLLQRRIEDVERRYRQWWEDNMAWRFRAEPPGCDGSCDW